MDTSLNLLWINVVTDNNPLRDFGLNGENIMVDDYGGIVVTAIRITGHLCKQALQRDLEPLTDSCSGNTNTRLI